MNSFLFKFYILFLISGLTFAQEDKVVAKVGNYKIYESEFRDRFDFSIHPKLLQNNDTIAVKLEFLKQLIAEKLLSLEAQEKAMENSEFVKNALTPMENMLVRDALYKNEIQSKVSDIQKKKSKNKKVYSEYQNEIKIGLERISKVLKLKFLFSKNEDEIKGLYTQLKSGVSFDSVLALRNEIDGQENGREITFGTMEKEIEDEVYKLKVGDFTSVLKSKDGFYILKLINIAPNNDLKDPGNTLEDVKRIVDSRIEYRVYLDYYHNFFAKNQASADKEIFEQLIKYFIPWFREKYLLERENSVDNNFYLRGFELSRILEIIDQEYLLKDFINLPKRAVKLPYFINQLSQESFYVQELSEKSIRSSLSSYIRKFIEDELLTDEAKRKGFQNLPEVKKDLGAWKDAYLSQNLMMQMMDSVNITNEELNIVYAKNEWKETSPQLINVVEVLTDKLDTIEKVINELAEGKDIKELAAKYTIRDSVKNRNGEFGLMPITKLGKIGELSSKLSLGEIYGPVKLDEGYSIFQLTDRVADTTIYTKSFDEVKKDLTKLLTMQRFEKNVNEYTANLANKFGVEINEDVLNNVDNSYLNLLVVRYMGFGGEVFAVPYTEQFSGWYNIWKKNQQKIQ